ncbi:MAG TPA: hypothetical protein PKL77_01105 [Candidatus Omnitrophota bacterium]|nr:hypothetical protein [Candidatus Omnitrophota bacterium]HPT07108.1 hypothetical protein [Candidatus Omnitrophota bacterium]
MPGVRKIGIFGDGRIARAVAFFFNRRAGCKAELLNQDTQARGCDLLVGALAGDLGEKCLTLALRYKKNLVDISDVDPPYYLQYKKQIAQSGITVIPGCGFSPGLTNFILGMEFPALQKGPSLTVKAGSLSKKKAYYPFLWCFEDLILEHHLPSWQIVAGKKKKFPPFAGYQKESFFGIDAESYYCASGFENILDKVCVKDFSCRVVRPTGFMPFFCFLKNYGFFEKKNMLFAKSALEAKKEDNITLGEISITTRSQTIVWLIKASAKKNEQFNSMQKITASVPVVVGSLLLDGELGGRGLMFMEDVGRQQCWKRVLFSGIKRFGVTVTRFGARG